MSLTVEEVLENAEYNLTNSKLPFQVVIGKRQLTNYKIAKELGAKDEDDWSDWEDKVEQYKEETNE